ncbi:unnamed protein product, partial [Symbiodinium necroappetens]
MKAGSLSGRSRDAGGPSPAPATSQDITEAVIDNIQHDVEQSQDMPEPESDTKEAEGLGFGELAKNLEFLMLKETAVELLEEKTSKQERNLQKCMEEKSGPKPPPSLVELEALKEERAQRAQTVLDTVLRKHEHQRETRHWVTPVSLEQREQGSSGINPVDGIASAVNAAVGKVADALESACIPIPPTPHLTNDEFGLNLGSWKCEVKLGGKTIPIIDIKLGRISQDWPQHVKTAITVGSGMKKCAAQVAASSPSSLYGCISTEVVEANPVLSMAYALFRDLWICNGKKWMNPRDNAGEIYSCLGNSLFDNVPQLSKAKPLFDATQACEGANANTMKCIFNNVMKDVLGCTDMSSAQSVAICLGNNMINYVPPFTFFNKIGDIIGDMIEGFARIAAGLMKQVLKKGQALIQQAVSTKFPAVGDGPMVRHESSNLRIYTHSAPPKKRGMSALQEEKPGTGLSWGFGSDKSHQQTRLITQRLGRSFLGHEVDTSSCLAFAPKNKHGHNGQATQTDWQVQNPDDFVPLEPWAVPCGNAWMKDNADKWQGYSFYSAEMFIDE